FFFSSRRRHTRFSRDWSSDVCSSDLHAGMGLEWNYPALLVGNVPVTALVLAGSRGGVDPVADAEGVTHKALVRVGAATMLERVKIGRAACRERGSRMGGETS